MKIIELLNKIANGEEPERFIKNNILWYKGNSDKEHYYSEGRKCQLNYIKLDELNDEIELIDEVEIIEEDKKIEEPKIDFMKEDDTLEDIVHITTINVDKLTDKICEIIDYINNKD